MNGIKKNARLHIHVLACYFCCFHFIVKKNIYIYTENIIFFPPQISSDAMLYKHCDGRGVEEVMGRVEEDTGRLRIIINI
jgi:hypothetical protein